jgi:L-alanine-DL-glutamate epimerase-like enolase superfamily enzyme
MKITEIRTTPLLVPYKKRYYWAQGTIDGAQVILVEVLTDEGITGYGECIGTPTAVGISAFIAEAARVILGRDPFGNARLMADAYQALFQERGTCSAPRFAGQVLAGIEMALWDIMGKATGHPVHALLGGAVHDEIGYFGFPQGATPAEIAAEARSFAEQGHEIIYVKVGQDDATDLEIIRQVRAAIGPDRRLRLDPNEHWGPLTLARMLPQIVPYGIECIEQPTDCESLSALQQVRSSSPIAIAADQRVFTPYDAFDVCRAQAADMIVLGLHETGGITRFVKAGRIAEAAGINICAHGLYETGITTCATHQAAAVLPNLDDGNQYMNHFLAWDIIESPDLALRASSRTEPQWTILFAVFMHENKMQGISALSS